MKNKNDDEKDEPKQPEGLSPEEVKKGEEAMAKIFELMEQGSAIPSDATVDREKLINRIIVRYGIDKDEIDLLYKTDEELVDYYNNTLRKSKTMIAEDVEDAPEDNYKLTDSNKDDLRVLEDDSKRRKGVKDSVNKIKEDQKKVEHEKLQATLPPDARVSYSEYRKVLDEAMGEQEED